MKKKEIKIKCDKCEKMLRDPRKNKTGLCRRCNQKKDYKKFKKKKMINKKDIGTMVEFNGIVSSINKPFIKITSVKYECPSCGSVIGVSQQSFKLKNPKCSCGRVSGFKTISQEETETQDICVLERGSDFGYIVHLDQEKLIRILTKIQEGCAVRITGLVKVEFRQGSTIGDLVILAKTLEQNKRGQNK